MDGLEATRLLRADSVTAPIIAVTANAMADQREEFLSAGADVVVSKPVEFDALLATLAAFGVHGRARGSPPVLDAPTPPAATVRAL
jgi:CheY-like chemotaxis protein